jgi:hypothetical protein
MLSDYHHYPKDFIKSDCEGFKLEWGSEGLICFCLKTESKRNAIGDFGDCYSCRNYKKRKD